MDVRPLLASRWAIAALAVGGFPILFPIAAAGAAFDTYARALNWRNNGPRQGTWFWRIWWFYGYHGLYQLDWLMKRRLAPITEWPSTIGWVVERRKRGIWHRLLIWIARGR